MSRLIRAKGGGKESKGLAPEQNPPNLGGFALNQTLQFWTLRLKAKPPLVPQQNPPILGGFALHLEVLGDPTNSRILQTSPHKCHHHGIIPVDQVFPQVAPTNNLITVMSNLITVMSFFQSVLKLAAINRNQP